ncbi:MAG: hypothetical protein KF864_15045 [Phycisphaeraceae bacterium]|nr:hypothetical protein [Phycisphaeraceae bacterium]
MSTQPMTPFTRFAVLALAAATLSASPASAQPADSFKREGEGQRRVQLNDMERKPFDQALWSKVSGWSTTAPTPGDLSGKVVVVCLWADWYAPSRRVITQSLRLAERFANDGVVVVFVHHSEGWDGARKPTPPKEGVIFSGHDTKNEFRTAILADQDPNYYVIDRAGQMRFADLDKSALESAVEFLVKETVNDASEINQRLAREAAQREADARRAGAINSAVSMVEIPELDFPAPTPDVYRGVTWPKFPPKQNAQPEDPNNPPAPIPMRLPSAGWLTPRPPEAGRATLMYFWHPDSRFTTQIMPTMDMIRTQRSRDLVVVGVVSVLKDNSVAQNKDLESDPKKVADRLAEFFRGRDLRHAIVTDLSNGLYEASLRGEGTNAVPLPWVAIVSSDGILRWSGWMGEPSFQAALERVVNSDPGIQARRAVEAEYLRRNNK